MIEKWLYVKMMVEALDDNIDCLASIALALKMKNVADVDVKLWNRLSLDSYLMKQFWALSQVLGLLWSWH